MELIKKYILNILIGIDQLGNALLGGDPDETISSRLGKNYRGSFLEKFVDKIFGDGHCEGSLEEDEGKDAILAKKSNKNKIV